MQNSLVQLLESIPEMVRQFGEVAFGAGGFDPFQFALLLSGSVFVAISVAFFGYLVVGALLRPAGNIPTPGRGTRDRREEEFRGN
jgi:hypothetical protein